MTISSNWINEVNDFWFQELKPRDWFSAQPELDDRIRTRFGNLLAALKLTPPDTQQLDAAGHVAAVIVFDQFSRNVFRGSGETYAADELALNVARHAIESGMHQGLGQQQRQFLYMPFMHSESRDMQQLSVNLFRELGVADGLRSAEQHKEVIDRFRRFPYRNAKLGRTSSDQELQFLRTHKSPK